MLCFYHRHHVGAEHASLGIEISVITSCSIIHPSWGQRPHGARFNPANNESGPASAHLCRGLHTCVILCPPSTHSSWQPVMLNGSRQLANINLYLGPNLCPKLYLLSLFFPISTWVTKNHLQPNLDLPNHWLAPSSNLLPIWILPNTAWVVLISLISPQRDAKLSVNPVYGPHTCPLPTPSLLPCQLKLLHLPPWPLQKPL